MLLLGLDRLRNQPDLVGASSLGNVNHFSHVLERQFRVSLDEHDVVIPVFEDVHQPLPQIANGYRLLIDADGALRVDGHYNRSLDHILPGLLVLVRLGDKRVQPLGCQGRDDHENNQQHQQYVDQRRHVEIHHRAALAATNSNCHTTTLLRQPAPAQCFVIQTSRQGWGKWNVLVWLHLFGDQAQLLDPRGTHVVHRGDNVAIFRPGITLNENHFVQLVLHQVVNLLGEVTQRNGLRIQEEFSVPRDGYFHG